MLQPDRTGNIEKRELRQEMLARRRALSLSGAQGAEQFVARHFADHPILSFVPSFAGYVAIQSELDVLPIFDMMQRFDKITALPCITENGLIFRRWQRGNALVRNRSLNVQEPPSNVETVIPALVLVPLLAFDADGYRLGYGAGYYDRTMEAMRHFSNPPLFVGVAHSAQEVDRVPTDAYDQRLDGVLTELGVSMF